MRQLYCFFGGPCSGKGTVVRGVADAWGRRGEIGVVTAGDIARSLSTEATQSAMADGSLFPLEDAIRECIYKEVRKSLANGAYVVLLDGAPRFKGQLEWVESEFFDLDPAYVRVMASSNDELVKRAKTRARDEFDIDDSKLMARINKQSALIQEMESHIFERGISYCAIMNDDVKVAVDEFLVKAPKPDFRAIRRKHG